jgi:hypothetical protein
MTEQSEGGKNLGVDGRGQDQQLRHETSKLRRPSLQATYNRCMSWQLWSVVPVWVAVLLAAVAVGIVGTGLGEGAAEEEDFPCGKQAVLVIGYRGTTLSDADRYPLDLLQEACSDLGSRLFLRIREQLGLADGDAVFFVLGLILESFSIILITMPAVQPVMAQLGIDPVWYGVLLTLNLEMALISPPVAMNLVVIKAITGAPMDEVNRAALPYMLMLALGIALLIAFPQIALWLPSRMG